MQSICFTIFNGWRYFWKTIKWERRDEKKAFLVLFTSFAVAISRNCYRITFKRFISQFVTHTHKASFLRKLSVCTQSFRFQEQSERNQLVPEERKLTNIRISIEAWRLIFYSEWTEWMRRVGKEMADCGAFKRTIAVKRQFCKQLHL